MKVAQSPEDLIPDPSTQALLFDLDGTLVDSRAANLAAYNSVLEGRGIQLPLQWYSTRFGLPGSELFREVEENWDVNFDIPALVAQKNKAYMDLLDEITLFSLTTNLLQSEGARRKIAVVTSGPKGTAQAVLIATGLDSHLHTLVAREDVASTKPSPDPYLLAAQLLDVEADRCVAYEDSDVGIEAAVTAGVNTIDVRLVCDSTGYK